MSIATHPATMHYSKERNKNTDISNQIPLQDHVKSVVNTYLKNMVNNRVSPENLYELVMSEVELPLIEATLEYTGNNQSTAAETLGINRGTFRKKLKYYGML
jgi:Fis family transcriptional regulator